MNTWEFSVDPTQGAASPKLNSSGMPAHWSATYTEDYYGQEGKECRPDDFRNPHGI